MQPNVLEGLNTFKRKNKLDKALYLDAAMRNYKHLTVESKTVAKTGPLCGEQVQFGAGASKLGKGWKSPVHDKKPIAGVTVKQYDEMYEDLLSQLFALQEKQTEEEKTEPEPEPEPEPEAEEEAFFQEEIAAAVGSLRASLKKRKITKKPLLLSDDEDNEETEIDSTPFEKVPRRFQESSKKRKETEEVLFPHQKHWSLLDFETNRPELTAWVRSRILPYLEDFNRGCCTVPRLLVHGQVKVGKREIVEYISMLNHQSPYKHHTKHVFISSFHRVADKDQREELANHHLQVYSVNNKQKSNETLQQMDKLLANPSTRVVIHWDECDYGTGDKQSLCHIYTYIKQHPEQVFSVLYSATPEELSHSPDMKNFEDAEEVADPEEEVEGEEDGDTESVDFVSNFYKTGVSVVFPPPEGYCGAAKFLEANLVEDAMPFFQLKSRGKGYELSEQGRHIIQAAKDNLETFDRVITTLKSEKYAAKDRGASPAELEAFDQKIKQVVPRFIVVLRLSYSNGDTKGKEDTFIESRCNNSQKAFHTFLENYKSMPELDDVDVYVDKSSDDDVLVRGAEKSRIDWGDATIWKKKTINKVPNVALIVHDQTSTRSTEWKIHDMVYATHDYRKQIIFNTIAQAQLRCAHYAQNYGGFQPIRVYGHLKTFQLCANHISVKDYIRNEWTSRKIPNSEPPRYRLIHYQRHPLPEEFGGDRANIAGFPHAEAKAVLKMLGSATNVGSKMSQRVSGKYALAPVIQSKFYPVSEPTNREDVRRVIEGIQQDPVFAVYGIREKAFQIGAYFNEAKRQTDEHGVWTGKWLGTVRNETKIYFYEELVSPRCGLDDRIKFRLTECYEDPLCQTVGLCLRVNTGEMEERENLKTHNSMYSVKV